jgi:glycosyltransferase involved in cell wall biosynthesis
VNSELVVISHLRWVYVWQRPQQLISRLARRFERAWFVEEPWSTWVARATLRTERHPAVTRVWLDVPGEHQWHVPFNDPRAVGFADDLRELLGLRSRRTVWLYTPMGLDLARALEPARLVYDVMDDLASFAKAPPDMRERQAELLREADIVFTGGRSLQEGVVDRRPDAHLFPSGVDPDHYAAARRRNGSGTRPVAGYVGVIDERLDLDLIAGLADELSDWEIRLIGPVMEKIDLNDLPRAENIVYRGMRAYEQLPEEMAELDVALMPFALNEATRSISPTKTLEYLAAGLPVVSTRIRDVVSDFGDVVELADDAPGFAAACRGMFGAGPPDVGDLLESRSWDTIAERMGELLGTR